MTDDTKPYACFCVLLRYGTLSRVVFLFPKLPTRQLREERQLEGGEQKMKRSDRREDKPFVILFFLPNIFSQVKRVKLL